MASEQQVLEALKTVFDPEIGINIVDLGLVYGVETPDEESVKIMFTLTSPACPVGPMIKAQIEQAASTVEGVDNVESEIVFSPPWDPREMCSDEAKFELGIF
ncbi:MAG: iron-sulfur cluster assembly protein [Chloroflexi bacterium]|nr:iron-sulfur cluster assembly protein [Chloroflexota bacterium]